MSEQEIRTLLSLGIHPAWYKAEEKLLAPLLKKFMVQVQERMHAKREGAQTTIATIFHLIHFIQYEIQLQRKEINRLREYHAEFMQRYVKMISEDERRFCIIEYARSMGQSDRNLEKDRSAFGRWFDMDAVVDRYKRRYASSERSLVFLLRRLGAVSAALISQKEEPEAQAAIWKKLKIERVITPILIHDGDNRLIIEAFRCLSTILQVLPQNMQEAAVNEGTLQYIYRSALNRDEQVWVQCEALSLLHSLSPDSLQTVLHKRLNTVNIHNEENDLFVRRRAVLLLGENLARCPDLARLIPVVFDDPSPFVRQALPVALHGVDEVTARSYLERLTLQDTSPQVRAATLLHFPHFMEERDMFDTMLNLMKKIMQQERDSFVLRVALKVSAEITATLVVNHPSQMKRWQQAIKPELIILHDSADSIAVRRWAAQTHESMWCRSVPEAYQLFMRLTEWLENQQTGTFRNIPKSLLAGIAPSIIGRVLSVLAQDDFGFDIIQGRWRSRMMRGHRFGMRLWRILHEFRNPSPDKREAFRHTIGRVFSGNLRAPSSILAELAETKVPGEPLLISSEAGWRPYLPLLDDMVSTLDIASGKVILYSSEGVTEVCAPYRRFLRFKARWGLVLHFAKLAHMRNWMEGSQKSPSSYVHALRKLGFEVSFHPHTEADDGLPEDTAVMRFFTSGLMIPLDSHWQHLQEYFFSVYQNSITELGIFTVLVLAYFFGKHLYSNWRIHKTRANLALVIGGWGTRGKSGTERIKAAMLNALGYGLVLKTSGCEAMFLYAMPYGKMFEMFLFRPYEKATIWEQIDVMHYAEGLNADVFLWECMALTPSYVRILQQHWVHDDLSTITNTFPDHENLQGPAGVNIPEVMTNFIPHDSTLITSEELMLPILREAARGVNTRVEPVGWLEANLLTPDVLQRFPYDEHPYNIALVIRMGQELGIAPDFALKEMADRVVPDLGVLKTYPEAVIKGRRLIFVNGMSANERFGCLSNWARMDFDKQDMDAEPGVWLSVVVNNRADRVARTRVFAEILVNDINVDQCFLIGSNLSGMMGYIEEAWRVFSQHLTLWPEHSESDISSPQIVLQKFAKRYRVASSEESVRKQLQAILQGLGMSETDAMVNLWQQPKLLSQKLLETDLKEYASDIITVLQRLNKELEEYLFFSNKISNASDRKQLDADLRELLHTWFKRKILIVQDYHASGDAIIDIIQRTTPPGFLNRVMGIQNIKGTGLDFCYRWQAWDTCFKACVKLRSGTPILMEKGLHELAAFHEFGLLSEEYVHDTIAIARQSSLLQCNFFQAELNVIDFNLNSALKNIRKKINMTQQNTWWMKVLEIMEALLDAGDAVKRRKTADHIYRDLIDERISIERAAVELQALNKRQKGLWLLGRC